MGVFWRVAGVVLRAATVVAIWVAGDRALGGDPPSDDMTGLAVLAVITVPVVFAWGVVDGVRGSVPRATGTWLTTVLCLALVPVVWSAVVERGGPGGLDLFFFMLVGGLLLFVVLLPALIGAVLGAGLRRVTQRAS